MGDSVQWVRVPDAQASKLSVHQVPLASGQPGGDAAHVSCPRSRQPPTPHKASGGSVSRTLRGPQGQAQPSSSAVLCQRWALRLDQALGTLTSEVFGHLHGTTMLAEKDLEQLMT